MDGRRLRIAVVGCGRHAFRSIFPSLDYVDAELIAACDPQKELAESCARRFGAKAACPSLKEIIQRGDVEAVLLVVGPKQHPELACEALNAGLHVWMEKPPSFNVAGVDRIIAAQKASGKNVLVGFKKAFMPAVSRMMEFVASGQFGTIQTLQGRFPMDVPTDGAAILRESRYSNWIGNGVHPLSLFAHVLGRPDALTVTRAKSGGGFILFEYPGGAVGNLHLAAGHSMSGPMERYEIVCERGHMVLSNNTDLRIYRPGFPFDYANGNDFTSPADVAALVYEPQHTLSTLHNKALFMQGFVQELEEFVNACLKNVAPARGTLSAARIVMECYEAGLLSQGKRVRLDDLSALRGYTQS